MVRDEHGQVVSSATVTWRSGDPSVATVDATGLATATGNGTVTLTATAEAASGGATVTVDQVVAALAVSPSSVRLALDDSLRLTVQASDANGHPVTEPGLTWRTSDESIATVDATGLVIGVGIGTATIRAMSDAASANAGVEVLSGADADRLVLAALYEVTDGSDWIHNDNWLTDLPLADWRGVGVDEEGRVSKLDLEANNLVGPIPPGLSRLKRLTELNLIRNSLTGRIPPELGMLASLEILGLGINNLTGPLPPELGKLSRLRELLVYRNPLSGGIPGELANLDRLEKFVLYWSDISGPIPQAFLRLGRLKEFAALLTAVCVPGTTAFARWLEDIRIAEFVRYCNLSDVTALQGLYRLTSGEDWHRADGWGASFVLDTWQGVRADSLGRVTALDLAGNGLAGPLPGSLGELTRLTELRIGSNALTGPVPLALAKLALREFHYADTELCIPDDERFRDWLAGLASHDGPGLQCSLTDREILETLFYATDGPNWRRSDNWLTNEPLGTWYGVEADTTGLVLGLALPANGLRGEIPAEVGRLSSLRFLSLSQNSLRGTIPADLGGLADLNHLWLDWNRLEGEIPRELGNLAGLRHLFLGYNRLEGVIPSELGNLGELSELALPWNRLTGSIPPTLGGLSSLTSLRIQNNDLTGPIPSGLGDLGNLVELRLGRNDLSGPIPVDLGNLGNLAVLELSANALTGPIPPGLGDLAGLTQLFLEYNELSGPLPSELADLQHHRVLRVRGNELTGPIPPGLGNLGALQHLLLNSNALTGPIPPELGDLSSLRQLRLAENRLTGSIPAELGKLSRLVGLSLHRNELTGSIPPELGDLSSLEALWIGLNRLTGSIPPELGKLSRLRLLGLHSNELSGSIPPELGALAGLQRLFLGWQLLSGPIPPSLGDLAELRELELGPNRLVGAIPPELGNLSELKELNFQRNDLAGPVPAELGRLEKLEILWFVGNPGLTGPLPLSLTGLTSLKKMTLSSTGLCVPQTTAFDLWLQGLEEVWARPCGIVEDKDRNVLREFYRWTNGDDWSNNENWLTDAPLDDWHGVTADTADVVSGLELADNGLSGIVPLETGDLSHLRTLALGGNAGLGGELPARMLQLALLSTLRLEGTGLCLPGAKRFRDWLGRIGDAEVALCPDDHGNDAGGATVGRLGERFEGRIESAGDEDWFRLDLAGAGTLTLESEGETALIGALYDGENQLLGFDDEGGVLLVTNVGPGSHYVQVSGLYSNTRGAYTVRTSLEPRAPAVDAYLTQPVQSHDFAVPLVADEEALLRVFVMADSGVTASMPPVRATFFRGGAETHSVRIDGSSEQVPWEMAEGDLDRTANAVVPGRVIVPGTEMVVEIDPDGTLDPSLGIGGRIPAEGRLALDIRAMPPFNVTAVPFLWQEKPDSSGLKATAGLTAEHEVFYETREWLPVADMDVTVREAVFVDYDPKEDISRVLSDLALLYAADAASGYYMGVPPWIEGGAVGVAYLNSRLSVSRFDGNTVAHEFGHNLSLSHSPCGGAQGVDGRFPHANGRIGAWGYDRLTGTLVEPASPDLMSYCSANNWISDYTYKKALGYRNPGAAATAARSSRRTLVVRGGVEEGRLRIEPAFVLDAPPALPERGGPYRLVGSDDRGGELFSLRFAMNEVADAETPGTAGFLFAIPAGDDWAGTLATITLAGPEGSVALEAADTSRPATTLVLDETTRRIVAILRETPEAQVVADGAAAPLPSTTRLVSRGIPSPLDWRR